MSFHPTLPLHKKAEYIMVSTKSRDPFLIELDDKRGRCLSCPSVRSVVDIGTTPGGWSQVVAVILDAEDNAEDFGLREEAKVRERGSWSAKLENKSRPSI
ncbi:hypothetical protein DFH29DRAFT_1078558 [Suillus ampliporus]|nr:hypothetical protein DFH29DRAFT_1078558 [Suillus ampliporus]